MANAVLICELVMRPKVHGNPFCFTIQFHQWYIMLSSVGVEEECDSDGGEGIATEEGDGEKKPDIKVEVFRCTTDVKCGT